jgi:hypothetical protein
MIWAINGAAKSVYDAYKKNETILREIMLTQSADRARWR